MNVCILAGSPRPNGNTAALLGPFIAQMEGNGHTVNLISLHDKEIKPCMACRACQKDWTIFGCVQKDDMQEVFDGVMASDLIVLATPIYSWYCTTPMKAAIDRLMYGMNKFYGAEKGPAIWAGKQLALIVTCGYRPEKGADLWEAGMLRYCKHSGLTYRGMFAERHLGYKTSFMDEEKEQHAREFANKLCSEDAQ